MSHAYHSRLFQPTGVNHCVQSNFVGDEINLIVARCSVLQIFALRTNLKPQNDAKNRTARLDLIGEFSLFGNIESLAVVRLPGRKRDALVMSFSEAKISVVEWNPILHDLQTVSLHFYENDEKLKEGHTQQINAPKLVVSPCGRCAVMLTNDKQLVVLPFRECGPNPGSPQSYYINLIDQGIVNVKDLVFLVGYDDPTVLILYEPKMTAPTRYPIRKNTCCITALSLEIATQKTATIWTKSHLPHDTYSLISTPGHMGGVIVLTPNLILYLNFTITFGISFNCFGDIQECLNNVKLQKSDFVTTFDAARSTWINSESLLLATSSSDLYLLTLVDFVKDSTYFTVKKVGESSVACCLCSLSSEYIFLGSLIGDSLLIRFSSQEDPNAPVAAQMEIDAETDFNQDNNDNDVQEPPLKRLKSVHNPNNSGRSFPHIEGTPEEQKLLRLYQAAEAATIAAIPKPKVYFFEVCDSLANIGPIVDLGISPAFNQAAVSVIENQTSDKKLFEHKARQNAEIFCCSGKGKDGALTIVQRGIRPEVNTSVNVPGCQRLWALRHDTSDTLGNKEDDLDPQYSRYLIISRNDMSMVLETGRSIQEITNNETNQFYTSGPTICVGNVCQNKRIVQVFKNGVYLLNGVTKTHEWQIPLDDTVIASAHIRDPYILLQFDNNSMFLLQVVVGINEISLKEIPNADFGETDNPITAFCLFQDSSSTPIFNRSTESHHAHDTPLRKRTAHETAASDLKSSTHGAHATHSGPHTTHGAHGPRDEVKMKIDEEEAELYGYIPPKDGVGQEPTNPKLIPKKYLFQPYYCAVTRQDGVFQIFRLKNQTTERVFNSPGFTSGPGLVCDDTVDFIDKNVMKKAHYQQHQGEDKTTSSLSVTQLLVTTLGSKWCPPFIFASLSNGDILVYQCFFKSTRFEDSLSLRLKRITHGILFHNLVEPKVMSGDDDEESIEEEGKTKLHLFNPEKVPSLGYRMVPFQGISNHNGVFITGREPYWVFCERDSLRFHPMTIEGKIGAFTPFHNISNPHGYIYCADAQGKMTIAQLDPTYEMEWSTPFRKLEWGCTISKITYHAPTQLVAAVVAVPYTDQKMFWRMALQKNAEEEKPIEEDEILAVPIPDRLPPLHDEHYEIRLLSPESWKVFDKFQFKEQEVCLCSAICNLNVKQEDGKIVSQAFLVMGTAYIRGEDLAGKGRILIFDILAPHDIEASKFDLIYEKDQRGPVSAVCQLEGLLAVAIGPKVLLYQFEDRKEIGGVAFFDCQILIVSMTGLKSYLLVGDIYKSVYFIRWKDRAKNMELLAKDYDEMNVLANEFLVDGNVVSFLVCDAERNLHLFSYAPNDEQSRAGQKLICIGNFYLGSQVQKFLRLRMNTFKTSKIQETKVCALYASLDGSLGYVSPISAEAFKKIGKLEMRMVSAIQHPAGLNPKAFRLTKSNWKMSHNHQRNIIDGELLIKFANLDRGKQNEVAASVNLTTDEVIDFLLQTTLSTAYF